ncbi:DUF418 domain-containing protein [Caulobacter sp. CCH9-E1]|jgi:uncharacterized protein|uniref:DUF418 domain-containing protein n=1 Tax=Caulobacter sp. CCH9-E1 TaxID=1768768 RepID=UPI00083755BD|nr:DUF418 domain-containing protein [Caulobacter sp. CCH9-E1]
MAKDRIVLLDALRGLAILGIFLCNIPLVFAPEIVAESIPFWPHGQAPTSLAVWWVTQVFFQQKFYTLFGLLFGASILLVGGEGGDRSRTAMIIKRLLALLAIGLFHGFVIWQGDVLWTYASVGLVALLVRGWSARRLLTAGIIIHLGLNAWRFSRQLSRAAQFAAPLPPQVITRITTEAQTETAAFTGDFAASLARTSHNYWEFVSSAWQGFPDWPVIVLGLMLMGMGLFKSGLLKGEASRGVYIALIAVGLSAQALVAAVMTLFLAAPSHPGGLGGLAHWMQSVTAPVVSLGYLGLMVLAMNAKAWRAIPDLLAPVGQMAFTNYVFESIVMTTLAFGGRGPVLYGKLDRPALAAIVVVTWIVQILASRWWLKRFSMGPLEWVWRLAYRGPTPLRRGPA